MRGFTLMEVAVSLLVLGVVVGGVASMLARTYPPGGGRAGIGRLGEPDAVLIEQALMGFLHAHHRLPCPDADGDGIEDCDVTAGTPISAGRLPVMTLELSWPQETGGSVAYGVYRGASDDVDLTVAKPERYTRVPAARGPACPPEGSLDECDVDPLRPYDGPPGLEEADTRTLNALDTCTALESAASPPLEGRRRQIRLPSDGTPHRVAFFFTHGDRTVARAFSEVAAALGCPRRLAEAGLTLRAAATIAVHEQVNRFRLAHMKLLAAGTASPVHGGKFAPASRGDLETSPRPATNYPQSDGAYAAGQSTESEGLDDTLARARARLKLAGERLVEARAVAEAVQRSGAL